MPKENSIQTGFHGGEFSPLLEGQVHAERYKVGLRTCFNYIPLLQGPLVRRPGTKYVTNAKDSTKPPTLIPFIFNQTQSYVLEFGDKYIRFFANNGQLITSSNAFTVSGLALSPGITIPNLTFDAVRDTANPGFNETIQTSSVVASGSILEVVSPYSYTDAPGVKYTQNGDTIYLTHQSYAPYKLQRFGNQSWTMRPILFQDGPYLPLNSYKTIADNARTTLTPSGLGPNINLTTGSSNLIYNATNSGGLIRITTKNPHGYLTGDKVFISGVPGTTEANNSMSSVIQSFWSINVVGSSTFDLFGSAFSNTVTGSTGLVQPALFMMASGGANSLSPPIWNDAALNKLRVFGLINNNGSRYWGTITSVTNPSLATGTLGSINLPDTTTAVFWQLGVYSLGNGFPRACCFHQDRLFFASPTNYPQQIDGSETGSYEIFAASGSSLQVTDNNAISFRLLSEQSNPIMWIKSSAQGLLAGSQSTEWSVTPNSQTAALTPTNLNATATSFFGSADVDAVQTGNATLYIQRAQRKIREMNFFFQIGTFRSTDLTEISEHISIPMVTKLAVQKETLPMVWAIRSDGLLLAMTYNRDDLTLKAGWARHQLGGQSDSAGTNPIVKSITVIPASPNAASGQVPASKYTTGYDEPWFVVQRSNINGSTFCSIEYMAKPFDDSFVKEDAFFGDCGATYDTNLSISGITSASSAIVTSASHGLSNGDQIRIVSVIGLNSSVIDINGNTIITNLVNENTFTVGSSLANTFALLNYGSSAVNSLSYSPYVSGGEIRKMVINISGLSWLNGDTVGILADGANHPDVIVQSGAITLNYRAAKVQIGYRYNSDGQTLRQDGGSAQGTGIGETSRISRVAFQLHNVGEFQIGSTFLDLQTVQLIQADIQQADQAMPLFTGIIRDSINAAYDFDGFVCFRQNSMLPGTIQSLTTFNEVQDV